MMHKVPVGRGPLHGFRARERFAARVEPEICWREGGAQSASDALLARHTELNPLAGKDAARLLDVRIDVLERFRRGAIAFADVLDRIRETQPIATNLRADQQHRRPAPLRQRELLQRVHHRRG